MPIFKFTVANFAPLPFNFRDVVVVIREDDVVNCDISVVNKKDAMVNS